mmetsp:Transcript_18281/g.21946  ORF Transcript_18281/g.21946 Transcript_18281/m.21946 type:complete len:287 (+) Transcript_18281:290-1150(+)|eukprot:CAMPEP_0197864884 /NCGR_PEP_ID=MMETSP1438-20131217/43342_1 /TAXON_ID=1461541 /ORGANISM="Pterosperma sp., Strain CCMP1384" /LENGTH=286 /DNA_ID=CAMNT_0043483261 /DNA_START=263 /DNA_END=1123 /DNA_ORIENTATION=+
MVHPDRWKPPAWATVPSSSGLVYLEGVKEGQVVETLCIDEQECYVLGRNAQVVDIQLDHPSLSRQHAALVHGQNGLTILDLGSVHGTFVNDQRLEPNTPTVVTPTDTFKFGGSTRVYNLKKVDKLPAPPPPPDSVRMLGGYGDSEQSRRDHNRGSPRSKQQGNRGDRSRSRSRERDSQQAVSRATVVPPVAPSPQDAAAAAAEYVRMHMAGPNNPMGFRTAEEKRKLLWGGEFVVFLSSSNPLLGGHRDVHILQICRRKEKQTTGCKDALLARRSQASCGYFSILS